MIFTSRAGLVCAAIYMLLVAAAFVVMLLTMDSTPMSGIFLVLLTLPWPSLIDGLGDGGAGSALGNGLLLLAGGLVNAALIYLAVAAVAALIGRARRR